MGMFAVGSNIFMSVLSSLDFNIVITCM
jgi:hypothetical protein